VIRANVAYRIGRRKRTAKHRLVVLTAQSLKINARRWKHARSFRPVSQAFVLKWIIAGTGTGARDDVLQDLRVKRVLDLLFLLRPLFRCLVSSYLIDLPVAVKDLGKFADRQRNAKADRLARYRRSLAILSLAVVNSLRRSLSGIFQKNSYRQNQYK